MLEASDPRQGAEAPFSKSWRIKSLRVNSSTQFPALLNLFKGKSGTEVVIFPTRFPDLWFFLLWPLFCLVFGLEAQPPIVQTNFFTNLVNIVYGVNSLTKRLRHSAIISLSRKNLPAAKTIKFTSGKGNAEE